MKNVNATRPAKVLIVDDEASIVDLICFLLEEAGYAVGTARHGEEALGKFNDSSWDAVITDRAMVQMNGEQLAEEIKKAAPGTPVILMTGLASDTKRPDLFVSVLSKPFTRSALLTAVQTALEMRNDE